MCASLLSRIAWNKSLNPVKLAYLVQVCRTYNFGELGSSKGMYFDTFLAPTRLNVDPVPWLYMDLSYLELPR